MAYLDVMIRPLSWLGWSLCRTATSPCGVSGVVCGQGGLTEYVLLHTTVCILHTVVWSTLCLHMGYRNHIDRYVLETAIDISDYSNATHPGGAKLSLPKDPLLLEH